MSSSNTAIKLAREEGLVSRINNETGLSCSLNKYTDIDYIYLFLQEYKDFDFGEVSVDEVHLSMMSSTDPQSGYYCSTAVLKLWCHECVSGLQREAAVVVISNKGIVLHYLYFSLCLLFILRLPLCERPPSYLGRHATFSTTCLAQTCTHE